MPDPIMPDLYGSVGIMTGLSPGAVLVLLFCLLVLSGLLTAYQKAIRLLRETRVLEGESCDSLRAASFRRQMEDAGRLVRRTGTAQILVGAVYCFFASLLARSAGRGWLTAIYALVLLLLMLLFGLVLPERASGFRAEAFARRLWYFFSPLLYLAGAVDWLLDGVARLILRLFRLREFEIPGPAPTEEDFLQMLEAGHAVGSIEDDNREFIANLFEFDDKIASEVMTHRTEIEALPSDASLAETMAFLAETSYTRFPVFEGSVDNIIGILHVKDLLFYREQNREEAAFSLPAIMRPAWFTPETRNISDLLREMQQNHIQMAIVIDEYGGTAGLLTIEDLIEQIVGNIEDEYDVVEQEMIEIAPGNWLVDGGYPLDRLERLSGVTIDDDEYDTVAGLVIDLLDRIPEEHERPVVRYGPLVFHVLAISDKRIARLRVTRDEEEDPDE